MRTRLGLVAALGVSSICFEASPFATGRQVADMFEEQINDISTPRIATSLPSVPGTTAIRPGLLGITALRHVLVQQKMTQSRSSCDFTEAFMKDSHE